MTQFETGGKTSTDQRRWDPLREEAEALAASLPPLLVAAERLASAVSLGVHGRRKAGMGETFWQFRRYSHEDPSGLIDWRQSAKSEHLFVREREWEAAEAVWFWRDGSPGMHFSSDRSLATKFNRANLLALALASLLTRGGERIGLLGSGGLPSAGRAALRRFAHTMLDIPPENAALPPNALVTRNSQLVWLSDFLSPLSEIEAVLRRLVACGLSGHLVHIIDPAEENFPYSGRARFESVAGAESRIFGRAESVRTSYRDRFRAHAAGLGSLGQKLGWSYAMHRTDRRPETTLVALYANLCGETARPGA